MLASTARFSPEDYLALEGNSNTRHEYRYGSVYAMAGGSDDHNRLAINLLTFINLHLLGDRDCQLFAGDVKVSYADSFFYYPDAFVTCDPRDRADHYIKRYPKLIVEVLSPATAAFDRGQKFADYQALASLTEYVTIAQERLEVEGRRRVGEGWETALYRAGETVRLESIGLELAIADLYRGVSWLSSPAGPPP